MRWPEKPTCHGKLSPVFVYADEEITWRAPDAHHKARTCSYCGSLHPEDLVALLAEPDVRLGGADHKYGWPHKFYIHSSQVSSTGMGKFYNQHILDQGYDAEALEKLLALLYPHGGIRFSLEDGKLKYAAPYPGYQQ